MSEAAQSHSAYVIDASVALKLFIEDQLSERAYDLFDLLAGDQPFVFHVPDLFFTECTNVLWKYVRWGGLSIQAALKDTADLARLGFTVTTTADLMADSLEFAHRYTVSAYDACYAALAARCEAPLVTADEKLARTIPGTIWLGDIQIDRAK